MLFRSIAILYPGEPDASRQDGRFADLFGAFSAQGVQTRAVRYHDDFCADVRLQLLQVDAVLVWINPIEDGHDRTVLDAMLRDVAAAGIFVSAHPDVILKLGTKEVLYNTREAGWGCDTHLYESLPQLMRELPLQLASGKGRVLKQNRGSGGNGVWKVQLPPRGDNNQPALVLQAESTVVVRHAKRGCIEEQITLGEFYKRCAPYFAAGGKMVDQAYQERLPEGTIRCYLVHDRVVGFGHQAVNALFPAPPGAPPTAAPLPGPRLYHPPAKPEFQHLKRQLEQAWLPAVQQLLGITTTQLPILWDCDFLLGPRSDTGDDTYVLCEINVSCVVPYPESAVPYIVDATLNQVHNGYHTPAVSG